MSPSLYPVEYFWSLFINIEGKKDRKRLEIKVKGKKQRFFLIWVKT